MNQQELELLFEHNYWVRDKILDHLTQVQAQALTVERSVSFGSVLGTLTHVLNAEHVWRVRCQLGQSPASVKHELALPSIEALRQEWAEEELAMRAYLDSLEQDALHLDVTYNGFRGSEFTNKLWQIMVQLLFHANSHFSEMAAFLTEQGHSPGNLDFIIYVREQKGESS